MNALTHTFDVATAPVPPTISPPERPLSLPAFLAALVRNPIAAWPRQVCEQPTFVQRVAGQRIVSVTDPALLKTLFQDAEVQYRKNPLEKRLLGALLGEGVLTAEGDKWRSQRRVVAPLFRARELLCHVPSMAAITQRTLDVWRSAGRVSTQQIDPAMMRVTFDVIAKAMLPDDDDFDTETVEGHLRQYLAPVSWDLAFGILGLPEWMPHPGKRRAKKAAAALRTIFADRIAQRRRQQSGADDLLGRLLTSSMPPNGCPMSTGSVVDNLVTFLVAGHETTAITLTWALFLLARYPEWQDRIADEVHAVAGTDPIEPDCVERLHVTQRVVKETMRLYPPVPILSRLATEPVQLGSEFVEPGDMVFVPVYAVHRHKLLWSDPDRFDPDRFLPEEEDRRSKLSFLPFGAGPRICIGMQFALMEATTVLATLLQAARFRQTSPVDPVPVARITLRPSEPVELEVAFTR